MVMVWTLALYAFNTLTAARAVSSAFKFFNLQMMVYRVVRSTKVSNALFCPLPTMVSASQSPMRVFWSTTAGRFYMPTRLGTLPLVHVLP